MSAPISETPVCDVTWDLSALFSGPDDPRIPALWDELHARSERFRETYRERLGAGRLSANELATALREYEEISRDLHKILGYAHLLFAADCDDPGRAAFLQAQYERYSTIRVLNLFFELELQKAPAEVVDPLMADPLLENYRHFVAVLRARGQHSLSEPEERILEETANTGVRAWRRLFEETVANLECPYTDPATGETTSLTLEETTDKFHDPDRAVRQAAADALTEGLRRNQRLLTFIFNNLVLDKAVEDRLRRHPYPEHSRHLDNELDKETVDLVVGLCKERHDLVERYYLTKRRLLGLDELTHIDRYAPLSEAQRTFAWEEARDLVLDAFGRFSPRMRAAAEEFFARSWIDAQPRPGKSPGAFCAYNTPDTHPTLLLSYLGKTSDVMTLAHELGHGIHASLSRSQTYFNFHGTLPLAELASIFAEMLVFETLVAQASDRDRLALYGEKIESIFASVFRQAAMFHFEQRLHARRREEGELTADAIGEMWQEELQAMFGNGLRLGDQHRHWWGYVSHFVQSPFYVYAYAFGELLTLSLYERAQRSGPDFAERYLDVLALGGSRSPAELMSDVEVDLRSREFWLGGLAVIERLVSKFEELVPRA